MNKKIQIAIVDDHALFREGLQFIIDRNKNYKVVFEADNGKIFLEKLKNTCPDIVLLDIDMPIMNGKEAAEIALKKYPNLKIIILSMFDDKQYYYSMVNAGVKGFILKDAGKNELERAINDVDIGKNYFSQKLLTKILANTHIKPETAVPDNSLLSKRELEVLLLVSKGLSNSEIADKMFISIKTVEGHKAKLMQKTNTHNSVSLIMYAIKNKLIDV